MTDRLTSEQRSRNMARVKGRDTKPEMVVRSMLHRMGYRFRLHRKDLPGKPDVVMPRHRQIILIHGCFWHGHTGCRRSARPSTNQDFWNKKIDANIARDTDNLAALEKLGWKVLVIWECWTKDQENLHQILSTFMTSPPTKFRPSDDCCEG